VGLNVLGDAKVDIESIDVTESGDTATADVKAKLEGGPEGIDGLDQSRSDVPLKKEDGNWKISDCSFARVG
jgi:ketosteroid isomerase-like protein